LVQLAFAGPDLEEEFRSFKKQEIEHEHGIDEKKMKIINDGKTSCCARNTCFSLSAYFDVVYAPYVLSAREARDVKQNTIFRLNVSTYLKRIYPFV
jgi:hypothetical protein